MSWWLVNRVIGSIMGVIKCSGGTSYASGYLKVCINDKSINRYLVYVFMYVYYTWVQPVSCTYMYIYWIDTWRVINYYLLCYRHCICSMHVYRVFDLNVQHIHTFHNILLRKIQGADKIVNNTRVVLTY